MDQKTLDFNTLQRIVLLYYNRKRNIVQNHEQNIWNAFAALHHRGSRSTFEFPSQVNLSGPSLYCT